MKKDEDGMKWRRGKKYDKGEENESSKVRKRGRRRRNDHD
jgi:hypothetical protein